MISLKKGGRLFTFLVHSTLALIYTLYWGFGKCNALWSFIYMVSRIWYFQTNYAFSL